VLLPRAAGELNPPLPKTQENAKIKESHAIYEHLSITWDLPVTLIVSRPCNRELRWDLQVTDSTLSRPWNAAL
jgi:hypothetical protein